MMLHKILRSFLTKGSVAVINLLILILTSKYLGISTRGEISILILNLAIIQMVNEVYTGYSLVHFISRFSLTKIYANGFIFTVIINSASNLVLYYTNSLPEGFSFLFFVLSFMIILNTFNCVLILSRELYKIYNLLSILQPLLLLIGILYFTFINKDFTLNAFLWPLVISFTVTFTISTYVVFRFVITQNTNSSFEWKPILKNGIYCQLAVLMYVLSGRLNYYLLESKPDVGLYSTASSLIESVLIITNAVTPILLSRVAIVGKNNKSIRFTLVFAKACLFFSLATILLLCTVPNGWFTFVLGSSFSANKNLMLALSPGIVFLSFSGIISHYFSGIGNLKMVSFYNFFGFVTTALLAPLLIKTYGIYGAVITTNISYFITFLVSVVVFIKSTQTPVRALLNIKSDFAELKSIVSSH
jgi:O-antigen/teichoic acid export membrane protein